MKLKNVFFFSSIIILLGIFFLFTFGKPKEPESKKIIDYSNEINIIEKIDFSFDAEIDSNNISDYKKFIENNKKYQKPISNQELEKQMEEAGHYLMINPAGKIAKNLKQKIIQELNIDFLLQEINQRELLVTTIATNQYDGYNEKELLFEDPQIGIFSVLLLVPDEKKEIYPAVINLHGHADTHRTSRDYFLGKDLAKQGFIVILPLFRAMGFDKIEVEISEELYFNGFTLMGLRIYETHLLIKYLKYTNTVNNDRIGIMGHSGGADVAHLTSRINSDVKALAFDMYPRMDSLCFGRIHCESLPELAYYNPQLNNTSTLEIPSKEFEYDYRGKDDRKNLIIFFKENL